jgi:4-aminobutyrate aminotransferase/(S)-3-amino-2-methylpropionate transaminase
MARRIEEIVRPRLEALMGDGSYVGDVRGRGAMLAMEFVAPGTKTPAPDAAKKVAAHAISQGVITLTAGTYGNVIRLLPPLVIGEAEVDRGIDAIQQAIRGLNA